jgi:YgiT-type zinc finger domain-containing protein
MKRGISCPVCKKGRYVESTTDCEYRGVIIPKVACYKCSSCGDFVFSPEHYEKIRQKMKDVYSPLVLKRKMSKAGNRPAVYLPEDLIDDLGISIGDDIFMYLERIGNKKRLVIEGER